MSWPNLLCVPQNTTFPPRKKKIIDGTINQVRERVNPTTFPSESRPPCHADRPPIPPSDDDIVNRFVQRGGDDDDIQTQTSTSSPSDTVFPRAVRGCPPVRPNSSDHRPLSCPSTRSRLSNLEPRVPPSVSVIAAGPRGRDLLPDLSLVAL